MSNHATLRAVSIAVLVCFLAVEVFAAPVAMLEPTGTVLVNDTQVSRMSTVFAGDRIKTGTDSGALISGNGVTVHLIANSALTVGPKTVALDQGGATMTLAPGASATVDKLTLTASNDGPASYDVNRGCGYVQITVKSGTINVTDGGGNPVSLTAGSQHKWDIARTAECSQPVNDTKPVAIGATTAVAAGLVVWFTTGETSHTVP